MGDGVGSRAVRSGQPGPTPKKLVKSFFVALEVWVRWGEGWKEWGLDGRVVPEC